MCNNYVVNVFLLPHNRTDNFSYKWIKSEINEFNMGRENSTYWKGAAELGGIS